MSSIIAATSFTRAGKCEQYPNCYCVKAQYEQCCQSCKRRVKLGDCIGKAPCGWTHVECPGRNSERERGLLTITAGLNTNVDYGNSFLRIGSSLPPLLLENGVQEDEKEEEDSKMPAYSTSSLQPRRLEFDEPGENEEDEMESNIPAEGRVKKRKKKVVEITSVDEFGYMKTETVPVWYDADDAQITQDVRGVPETPTAGTKKPPPITPDDDCPEDSSRSTYKRSRRDEQKSSPGILSLSNAGDYADEKRTNEQMEILMHRPELGEVVVVNALAGCGKTTTIALLCNKVHEEDPSKSILYLVYNNAIQKEAGQSKKFPKQTEIRTTHAYVLRHYFGIPNMHSVKPVNDYKLDTIIDVLDLVEDCRRKFRSTLLEGRRGQQTLEKRVKTVARDIRKTLNNFQASASTSVEGKHIPMRAKMNSSRNKWREEISVVQYFCWATQLFNLVLEKCHNIKYNGRPSGSSIDVTHDGYMKVAQLEQLHIPYDYVFVDESQDMSACQADFFWKHGQRNGKRIYLFGDKYQQIYRFRGASRSFRDMVDESKLKFSLTGSFRFGKNIAACATIVLKAMDGEILCGRSKHKGQVESYIEEGQLQSTMKRGIVLCRTQNGIFRYLFSNRPARWCNLSGRCSIPESPKAWQLDLERFVRCEMNRCREEDREQEGRNEDDSSCGEESSDDEEDIANKFAYKGEIFTSLTDIYDYTQEEDDIELGKAVGLLKFLASKKKPLTEFYNLLRMSFCPMSDSESAEEYDGVIVVTTHSAKGLEWSCPVLIYDDYKFDAITSAVTSKEKHCDEANLLYVAITRAKCHLYLTKAAKLCLEEMSKLDHVQMELPAMMSIASSRGKYNHWKDSWKSFKDGSNIVESIDRVPYPPDWTDGNHPLALHPEMSVYEQRTQLLRYLRAYHPDKFYPKYGDRIKATVWPEVKDILEQITRKCTEFLGSLQDEDGDQ